MGLGKFFGDVFGGDFSSAFDSLGGLFESIPKEVATAGLFSGASLVSELFGRDVDGETLDLARDKFEQDVLNQQSNLAFNREELASRENIAKQAVQAQVQAAGIAAGAQREIARARNRTEMGQMQMQSQDKAADRNADAIKGRPELIMTGRTAQANQARATGQAGAQAFDALMRGIQAGLTR